MLLTMNREYRKQIRDRRHQIDKDLREEKQRLLAQYESQVYYPAKQALYKQCEELTNHDYHFTDLSPLNHPMFVCQLCGKLEIRKE